MYNGNIKRDLWLSGILNRESFILTVTSEWLEKIKEGDSKERRDFLDFLSKEVFIYTKVKTTDINAVCLLESYGFNLVDTNIIFEKNISRGQKIKVNTKIRIAEEKDIDAVGELGRNNFVYSRFHLDPHIPLEIANEIKSQWVRNYFKGKKGDQLLVAELDNKVVGFNQLIFGSDNSLIIDLIAIDKGYVRRGIASDLIVYAEFIHNNKSKIIIGTQAANIVSIRLYEKLGFRVCESKYILHYHNF